MSAAALVDTRDEADSGRKEIRAGVIALDPLLHWLWRVGRVCAP